MKSLSVATLGVVTALGILLNAQAPSFEVASIKLNKTGEPQSVPQMQRGGRVTLTNRTLRSLVQFAYSSIDSNLHDLQILGGPNWANSDRFDIMAKMEGDPPPGPQTANLARVMLRALLAERFQLKLRTESRELPVYALVLARPDRRFGPGLRARHDSCEGFVPRPAAIPDLKGNTPLCGYLRGGRGVLNYRGVAISQLLRPTALAGLDRIVIDQTGLLGLFDIDLTWSVDTGASSDAPSIFTAVQEQLGLKLDPTRAPVEVLVIEDAQRPTPD
jgi:uncharacterized protein (TIGR03435 family)